MIQWFAAEQISTWKLLCIKQLLWITKTQSYFFTIYHDKVFYTKVYLSVGSPKSIQNHWSGSDMKPYFGPDENKNGFTEFKYQE